MNIRPARSDDYATYAALFRELAVDDPVRDAARFEAELLPTTLVAEDDGPLGYAYFRKKDDDQMHVSEIVTAPGARRRGVARALMHAVAARSLEAGCARWCLNVKRDNAIARALYESLGLRVSHESTSLAIDAVAISRLPDARVLTTATDVGARVKLVFERDGFPVGEALFDARSPGAAGFRAASPELVGDLVRAIADRVPGAARLVVTLDEQPELVRALLDLGARVRFEMFHMRGALTSLRP